jgi:putative ABC transport system ATP-binding protein
MEKNLFKYIWHHSRREQIAILLLVVVSLPFYFLSLDLPKQIVNKGIQGIGFEVEGATQSFGVIALPLSETLFGENIVLFDGLELDQVGMLLALSFAFLALVCVNGAFKFLVNTAKGRLGERMLRRLRFELSDRLLRFRLPQVRRMKSAEVATMIKDEVEPLGGFIGDAFVTPAFLGGQAITAMLFIMVQSIWLGVVAGGIVLVQALLIPKLRVKILLLGKQRQLTARQLAGRIAEVMDGATEVHSNDTSHWERAELTRRLGRIYDIRFEIYRRKFAVKFLNNFLSQFTPFIFYVGGGLLAISGKLDIGALVAVIAAYKDLPGPMRELINWEQRRNDVQIKYDQVIEQFQPTDILSREQQDPEFDAQPLVGDLMVNSLTLLDDDDARLLDSVSFTVPSDEHVAVVGDGSSGKDHLTVVLAGLLPPDSGSLRFGEMSLESSREAVTGRRLGYIDQDAYLFPTNVRENLIYSLRHRPLRPAAYDEAAEVRWREQLQESKRAGNSPYDINADWIDYEAAGVQDEAGLVDRLLEILDLVDLGKDIYRLGLNGSIDPTARPEVAEKVLQARAALAQRLANSDNSDLVMRFDAALYNNNASLAENLLFGTPKLPSYEPEALADNPVVLKALEEISLTALLVEKGQTIARTMVEIFADLPPGHPFFDQFSFIDADDLPEYRQVITRAEQRPLDELSEEDRKELMRLPFRYIEARHRLGLVDEEFETKVVAARKVIAETIRREAPDAVEFYDETSYNTAASLMDNILFGRLVYGQAGAEETVGSVVSDLVDELDLRHAVCEVGLDYDVGVGAKRLSNTQRQKLALARALNKQPDLLIVNQATSVMDGATRARVVAQILAARKGQGVIWALERPALAEQFDRVLVMQNGRLIEQGEFASLSKEGKVLPDLLSSD